MTALDILLIILGFLAVVPPAYIYYRDKEESYKALMILSFVAGPLWAFSIAFFRNATDEASVMVYAQIIYTVSLLLGLFFYLFEQYFPKKKKHGKYLNFAVYSIGLLLLYSIWFTKLFLKDVIVYGNNNVVLGPLYLLWMVWMLGIFTFGVVSILIQYQKLGKVEKKQLKYFIFAIILPVVGVVPTNAIFPLLGIYEYIWVGPIAMSFMTVILTYGITSKYSESKAILFSKVIRIFALLIYILLVGSIGLLMLKLRQSGDGYIYVITYFVFSVLLFLGGSKGLELLIGKIFKGKILDYTKMRDEYLDNTSTVLQLQELIEQTGRYLFDSISVTWLEIVITKNGKAQGISYLGKKSSPAIEKHEDLTVFLDGLQVSRDIEQKYLNADLMEYSLNNQYDKYSPKILKRFETVLWKLNELEASEVALIKNNEEIQGFCLLGYKRNSSSSITPRERELILSILNAFSLGISRAQMHSQLEDVNEYLQEKVSEQTKELRIKVVELEEARKKERDMIDIMGHELRTPATVVKLNVELLQKYVNSNPDEFKRHLGRIKEAIDTEIKLINTLLSSAKLEGDKIDINSEQVDILQEVDMCIHGHVREAKVKKLKLINKAKKRTPTIYADKARVIEILNNLLDNAIKYTEKGSVTVKTEYDKQNVTVSIEDTGRGIPKDELSKLGKKFYRVDNYIEGKNWDPVDIVRPGGTGLGLYVTFNLVKLMKGKIGVESKLGKGSKFIFTLPIYKGQDERKVKKISLNMFERMGLKK